MQGSYDGRADASRGPGHKRNAVASPDGHAHAPAAPTGARCGDNIATRGEARMNSKPPPTRGTMITAARGER